MKEFFSIGEMAKIVNMTSETLIHYDRINLVKPSKKDEWTNYRYYTSQDIVRLNTVRALQLMDMPLKKIKEILSYGDLKQVTEALSEAEKKADEKIAALKYAKSKIQLAKSEYEKKLNGQQNVKEAYVKHFPPRVIMLSDTLKTPSLDNLWNYLSHFYDKIEPSEREFFSFEDSAGIYTENGLSRLFAICVRYKKTDGLKILPQGNYLCSGCSDEDKEKVLNDLIQKAVQEYNSNPEFYIQLIVVSGILQWNYQIQIYLG